MVSVMKLISSSSEMRVLQLEIMAVEFQPACTQVAVRQQKLSLLSYMQVVSSHLVHINHQVVYMVLAHLSSMP